MPLVAWRVCKVGYRPYDGTGAMLRGGRWNSAGRAVVYASDSFAGAILEILAHAVRPRTLPGAHHAARFDIPEELVETLESRGYDWVRAQYGIEEDVHEVASAVNG